MDVASQAIIIHTLSKYRVDIACLSEVRLPHFGFRVIINPGSDQRYWLYHYGASNNSERNVKFDKAHSALSGNRVYTPILSVDDLDKDKFCVGLQLLTKSVPKHIITIEGDWNAHVGYDAVTMNSAKLNQEAPFVASNVTDAFAEPYA
ncbi:unnamed protein product [Dracunculus medinensis]|uniref:Endo/exonuclease/phosphatase domain-containing protein n=1 Tax=Dracunculus medinensis TaxID=318479 RepID=A0A0N4U5I1_DRAME|nr:unnamed protein product [Dracunculus medinensis]